MRKTSIGGQAVMEGVMMKSMDNMAVAVRRTDGQIAVQDRKLAPWTKKNRFFGLPFVRGAVNLADTMTLGMKVLTDSAMMAGHAPGVLPDGRPVAPSRLAALLCDSDIARVVLSSHSEPIDISRKQRLFSARQVRAVRARDRRCRYPGCERGPELCQVHHVQEHERGGPTTIDNAVLMCFHHHDYIHDEQITVAHHSGGFVFSAKDGNVIGVSRNETYARRAQARSDAA